MSPPAITVLPTSPEILEKILPLIAQYQEFYQQKPNTDVNRKFFSQFTAEKSSKLGIQFAALDDSGRALGFATLYFLPSSLTGGQYCGMNDLLVDPEARGLGIGRKLIEHCRSYARNSSYGAIYWMTQNQNKTAQTLYDKLTGDRSEWFYYALSTTPGEKAPLA